MGNFKIDKSAFDETELAEWDRLIAKGAVKVDPEAAKKEMEGEEPPAGSGEKKPAQKAEVETVEETKKSAPAEQEAAAAALEAVKKELAEFKQTVEMQQFTTMAKKYAPLGKKEDELAQTLYDLKKSSDANYTAYVSILDEHLALVEKSGMFGEIGKSAGGYSTTGGAVAKAEAKAKEIQKADPSLGWGEAIAKAWEDPALMAEYDAEYYGR